MLLELYNTDVRSAEASLNKVRLEVSIKGEFVVLFGSHNTHLLIFSDTLLKEICFSFQRNMLHEVERIACLVNLNKILFKKPEQNFIKKNLNKIVKKSEHNFIKKPEHKILLKKT